MTRYRIKRWGARGGRDVFVTSNSWLNMRFVEHMRYAATSTNEERLPRNGARDLLLPIVVPKVILLVYEVVKSHSLRYRSSKSHFPRFRNVKGHSPRNRSVKSYSPRFQSAKSHSPRYRRAKSHSPRFRSAKSHCPRYRSAERMCLHGTSAVIRLFSNISEASDPTHRRMARPGQSTRGARPFFFIAAQRDTQLKWRGWRGTKTHPTSMLFPAEFLERV